MFRFLLTGFITGNYRNWVDQICGFIDGTTILTAVAILIFCTTLRTLASNITIRKEQLFFVVKGLLDDLLFNTVIFYKFGKYFLNQFLVFF